MWSDFAHGQKTLGAPWLQLTFQFLDLLCLSTGTLDPKSAQKCAKVSKSAQKYCAADGSLFLYVMLIVAELIRASTLPAKTLRFFEGVAWRALPIILSAALCETQYSWIGRAVVFWSFGLRVSEAIIKDEEQPGAFRKTCSLLTECAFILWPCVSFPCGSLESLSKRSLVVHWSTA